MQLSKVFAFILIQHSFQLYSLSSAALPRSYSKPLSPFIKNRDFLNQPFPDIKQTSSESQMRISPLQKRIPDALSVARLVSIPFFVASFVAGQKSVCSAIFAVSCFTDFLDGYLARRWGICSPFGAFIDPVADKMSVAVAMVMLVTRLPEWWFAASVAMAISREIMVSALREWMAERSLRASVKVGALGKLKTALQMVSIVILLYLVVGNGHPIADELLCTSATIDTTVCSPVFTAGMAMYIASVALSMISGGQYLAAAWPVLSKAS